MKKVLLVLLCCLSLCLMPPGSSAKDAKDGNQGQAQAQTSSGIPQTEVDAKKLINNARVHVKGGKFQEAEPLIENVKNSNFKYQFVEETDKLDSEIKTAKDEAQKTLEKAKDRKKEGKLPEAKELAEKVKKTNFEDLSKEAEQLLAEIETALAEAEAAEANSSLDIARGYQLFGQYDPALKKVESVLNKPPKNPKITTDAKDLVNNILKDATEVSQKSNRDSLASAKALFDAGDYDDAIAKNREVLARPGIDATTRHDAESQLTKALNKKTEVDNRKETVMIDQYRRLAEQGNVADASTKLQDLIQKIKNDKVLAEAEKAWDKTEPTTLGNRVRRFLVAIWAIVKTPVYGLIILGFLMAVLKGAKEAYQYAFTSRVLQIREMGDGANPANPSNPSNPRVMDLFLASLHQWGSRKARASEGLLRLEVPRSAALLGRLSEDKLLTALQSLPPISGVELRGWASALQRVGDWFVLCPPWMKATFTKEKNSDEIIAQVTLQRRNDQVAMLYRLPMEAKPGENDKGGETPPAPGAKGPAAGASGGPSPENKAQPAPSEPPQEDKAKPGSSEPPQEDKTKKTSGKPPQEKKNKEQLLMDEVDSLAFKFLYLLSEEEATVKQAEEFDNLRSGLAQLNQHLTREKLCDLADIGKKFQGVQKRYPRLLSAYLYEGFILDLLGKHEEAARKFEFVKMKALEEGDEDLSQRAAYNEAIAHLHNYTYEEVLTANLLLKILTGPVADGEPLRKSPLKAMAYAAQACVVAHLPLFWKEVEPKLMENLGESEILYFKRERQDKLRTWQQEVKELTDFLEKYEQKVSADITTAASKTALPKRLLPNWNRPERSFPDWNRSDCRKLQLSIHDARAHLYLNCATEFLDGPTPGFRGRI